MIVTVSSGFLYAAQGEWPCFRGPNHDDKSSDRGLLKEWPTNGPAKLWQFSGLGKGFSTVSVSSNAIYTSGDVDGQMTLFALDMDGKLKWKVAHDRAWTQSYTGARSMPTVDGDMVYLVSGHGLIGCYSAKSGAKAWTRTMQELGGKTPNWGYAESVLIDGKMAVVTPGGAGCITALDKATGKTIWQSKGVEGAAHYGSCTPFNFNDVPMIVAATGGGLFCVDAGSGTKIFSNPFSAGSTANIPSPAAADGYVFWATGYGKGSICMKLGPTGAELAWTTKELVCHHGGYLIENGFNCGNHERGVACLDLKTGQRKWFDKGVGKCSITYADGMLYPESLQPINDGHADVHQHHSGTQLPGQRDRLSAVAGFTDDFEVGFEFQLQVISDLLWPGAAHQPARHLRPTPRVGFADQAERLSS